MVVVLALFGVAGAAPIRFMIWRCLPDEPAQRPGAPAFTLPALDGVRFSLPDFKGQVVLLYFWATW